MKYFVLLAGYGELPSWEELTAEEQEAGMAQHVAFDEACAARPGVELVSGEALGDGSMATTLRTRGGDGKLVSHLPGLPSSAIRPSAARPIR